MTIFHACIACCIIYFWWCIADFQKAAALIHELQLKLSEDVECAELRDALNLALLHMQKYYRYKPHPALIWSVQSQAWDHF